MFQKLPAVATLLIMTMLQPTRKSVLHLKCEWGIIQVMEQSEKPNIPKYIRDVPWYYKANNKFQQSDSLGHHAVEAPDKPQDGEQVFNGSDASKTHKKQNDQFDAKRDRWQGFDSSEWDEILLQWNSIKKEVKPINSDSENSDDTDYEMELSELSIERKNLKKNTAEDSLEKSIREKRDMPAYIRSVNANAGGKIRVGKDTVDAVVNDDSEFVKDLKDDVQKLKQMQKFVWEQNKEFESARQRELFKRQVEALGNSGANMQEPEPNSFGLSIEANPTLTMMKNKENEDRKRQALDARKKSLLDKYG